MAAVINESVLRIEANLIRDYDLFKTVLWHFSVRGFFILVT